jgi:hypothetical protein
MIYTIKLFILTIIYIIVNIHHRFVDLSLYAQTYLRDLTS